MENVTITITTTKHRLYDESKIKCKLTNHTLRGVPIQES